MIDLVQRISPARRALQPGSGRRLPRVAPRLQRSGRPRLRTAGPETLDLPVHKRNRLKLLADMVVFYGARHASAVYGRFARHNELFSGTVRVHAPAGKPISQLLGDATASPLFAADRHAPRTPAVPDAPGMSGSVRQVIYLDLPDDVQLAMVGDGAGSLSLDIAFIEFARVPAPEGGALLAAELHLDVADLQEVNFGEFLRVIAELERLGYIVCSYGPSPLTERGTPWWAGHLVCPWECGAARR